jgi:hypothetical protein
MNYNNTIAKPFKLKSIDDELNDYLDKHENNFALDFDRQLEVIMIKEPEKRKKFIDCLAKVREQYPEEIVDNNIESSPYRKVYVNRCKSIDRLMTIMDRIYSSEAKPFKITFTYGFILEIRKPQEKVKYESVRPHSREDHSVINQTILDTKTFKDFKQYLLSSISDFIQNITYKASSDMYICIDSICFDVSRIGVAGAKIAGLEELINHKQVFSYNSDDNLCLFAALVYHYQPQNQHRSADQIRPKAKVYYKDYYGYNFNLDYKGFNLTEFQKFCNHFKINVTVYCFDRKAKKNKTETQDLYRIQQEYFAEPESLGFCLGPRQKINSTFCSSTLERVFTLC